MLTKLTASENKVVGTRRLLKAVEAGKVMEAYLAMDADLFIFRKVNDACKRANVPVVQVDTMKALGEACKVQVETASAGILK